MPIVEQNGGGASGGDGLPLYYVHAANGNKGNGTVENPFGSFELLNAFFDANPTVVGSTIIVLGGTFVVSSNIYRGNSFFFFPGTKIISNAPFLLKDDGSYNGYSSDFFFTGEVEIVLYGGAFIDLGFFYSNQAKNAGKKWTINIASLKTNGGTDLLINKLYGSINSYQIIIARIEIVSTNAKFFYLQQDQRPIADSVSIANNGCVLNFKSTNIYVNAANVTIVQTGTNAYAFLNRYPFFEIEQIVISSSDFCFYRGRFNLSRKMVFTIKIQNVFINTNVANNTGYMIDNTGGDYINGGEEKQMFVFEGTKFTWNERLAVNTYLKLAAKNDVLGAFPIFIGCTKHDPYFLTDTDFLVPGCYDIAGFYIASFSDNNRFLCNTIINN